jgi:hypothetical protein
MFIIGSPSQQAGMIRFAASHGGSLKAMRTAALALLGILLAACAPRAPQPAAPPGGFPPDFPTAFYSSAPAIGVYRVAPGRSSLVLKVYRAGTLAALGHNHVITTSALEGFIYLADDLAAARADLFVPVSALTVDDSAARAAAGPDFAAQPSLHDIDGTRTNMLGPKLLDAEHFPYLIAHVTPVHVRPESTDVTLGLTVHGQTVSIPVTVTWLRNGEELEVRGTFSTDHKTLMLEPFSTLGGALRVAEQIDVAVALVAEHGTATSAGNAPDS